jgi:uncharacterized protein DUF3313
MKIRQWFALACGSALIAAATAASGQAASAAPSPVEGLVKAKSSQLDQVYLRPGVDFHRYTKVMFDPVPVAFDSLWLTNMNFNKIAVLQGTTSADAQRIAGEAGESLRNVFAGAFRHAGYETVAEPAPGVLQLSLSLTDLYVNAPKTTTQALPASRVLTHDAGRAVLGLDVRDSVTGELLARFVDFQMVGIRARPSVRTTTTATNQFDFESMFGLWAFRCIDELKSPSPIAMAVPRK